MDRKKVCLVVFLLCLMASTAFALDIMGPLTAALHKDQFATGFEYSYSRIDVSTSGLLRNMSGIRSLDNVESSRFYARLAYGLSDNWEIYYRLGGGDAKVDDEGVDFNGDNGFAGNVGTRVTFLKENNVSWGVLGQIGWLNSDGIGTYQGGSANTNVDLQEIQLAIGPKVDMGGWSLYGGALYYQMDGDFDTNWAGGKASADIDVNSDFGGYIGAHFDLGKNLSIEIESAMISDGYSIGTGIVWKF